MGRYSRSAGNKRKTFVSSNIGGYCANKSAELFLEMILDDPKSNDYLIPSYMAALCAGIEGAVNDAYISFLYRKMGGAYREFVRPYILARFPDKFRQLIPLISSYKYKLNQDADDVRGVLRLFDVRNSLLHVKHHWHAATIIDLGYGSGFNIVCDEVFSEDPYRDSPGKVITAEDLKRFKGIYDRFVPAFSNIEHYIKRKNFSDKTVKAWFVKISTK